ncbi:hypothetical protein ACWGLE_27695 [Streptomyces sp. NPDC055897]
MTSARNAAIRGPTAADREVELSRISASMERADSASGTLMCQRSASRTPQRAALWNSEPMTGLACSRTAATTSRAGPDTRGLNTPWVTTSIAPAAAPSRFVAILPPRVLRTYCWMSSRICVVARPRSASRFSLRASRPSPKRWNTGPRRRLSQPRIIWNAASAAAETGSTGFSSKSSPAWITVPPHALDTALSRSVLPDCLGPNSATIGCR